MSRGSRGTRYGAEHEAERRRHLAAYRPGDPCVLCGRAMVGSTSRLHLAHNEGGIGWRGLSHGTCNMGDAGRKTGWGGRPRGHSDPDPRPFDWTEWK